MGNPNAYIPFVQVRHNCLLVYDVPIVRECRASMMENMGGKRAYSGEMTEHGRRRILKSVDLLLQKSPTRRIYNPVRGGEHDFRINFVTLTIADERNRTAREGYDTCLKPFLRTARRKWGVEDYIWKAELQNRGQLHYHLTTNKFIHLDEIRTTWNSLQKKAGYLDSYARKHRHFNPNSTDVHAVWKVRNLGAYLGKYIAKNVSKNEETAKLNGKIWDCSNTLKIDRFSTELTQDMREELEDAAQHGQAKITHLEHCTIIHLTNPAGILTGSLAEEYQNHLTCGIQA